MNIFIKSLSKLELNELWHVISNDSYFDELIVSKCEIIKNITLEDFYNKNEDKFSTRLKHILLNHMQYHPENCYKKLSDINVAELKSIRNFGQKSLDEFNKLRGY